MSKRECGDCTACCSVLNIPALESPPGENCRHLTETGCGIYRIRPYRPCRTFNCAWLEDHFDDDDRPDKSGVILWQCNVQGQDMVVASLLPGRELPEHVCKILDTVKVPVRIERIGEKPVYWREHEKDEGGGLHAATDQERTGAC